MTIVIDMQKDFVTGPLGSPEARAIVPNMVSYLSKEQGEILFTQDTHGSDYLSTFEGEHLPVSHCVKDTEGHEIIDELKPFVKAGCSIEKPTFGSQELAHLIESMPSLQEVVLMGVCTDICVVSNALLLRTVRPSLPIKVAASLCAGTSKERHEAALDVMRSCQIEIV